MSKKEKIVTFDLDGTLADTAPALLNAGNELLKSIGRKPINLEQYKGFIGGGTKKQVEKLLNYTGGIPDRGLDFYFKFFQDRYYEDPVSMSAAAQKDTDNQQQAVLDLIDAVADAGGEIYSDWSGETYTRETAKQYILEYGK